MLQNLDNTMLYGTSAFLSCSLLDTVMPAFSAIGNSGFIWLLACFFYRTKRRAGLVG